MQRLVVPLLVLLCAAAASADFADDIYAGSLAPFSYAELQAEMTPSTPYAPGSTVFLAPESLIETRAAANAYAAAQAQARAAATPGQPVAFPFQQPPMPADLAGAAAAYAPNMFAQSPMLQNLASTVEAAIANAPGLGLLEAQSAVRRSVADDDDMGEIMAAEPTRSINPLPHMRLSSVSQISSGSQLPPPALSSGSVVSGLSSGLSSSVPVPAPASTVSASAGSLPVTSGSGSGLPSISSALSSLSTPSTASQSASSSSRSGSSVTPIAHAKKKHRCVPKGNNGCVVDIDPRSVHWTVTTVPRGTFAAESAASEESSRAFESSRSASASQAALVGESAYQQEFSENPTIAAAQKQFYDKQADLMKEKRWIADVKKIIDEYQNKIRNVQRHTTSQEMDLAKSRKSIVNMIKAEKAKKLEGELRAALDSLKKLETTSQALNSKMGELKSTKQGLQSTISKIQRVIGSKGGKAMSLVETGEEVTEAQKSDANDSAKQLFASLIQLISKAQQSTTEKERALHQAYSDHRVAPRSHEAAPMHTHGAHLRALNRQQRHNNGEDVDLMEIDSKAHSIADKYVTEENERLHMEFPLQTLALRDMRKTSDDDLFLDF